MFHTHSKNQSRRAALAPIVLFCIVAIGLIGVTVYALNWGSAEAAKLDPILASVVEGEFVSQVLDQGEIQSSENVEIRCEAKARNGVINVIEVIPEGTPVHGGDFLVRLDSTPFETELETQKISVATTETAVIQAEAEWQTAIEALKEYEQGIFVEKKKLIENDIYTAKSLIETSKQELTQAKAQLEHSKKLQGKGFITSQQLEVDGFEVKRAEFALEGAKNQLTLAETQERVLVEITQVKEKVLLKSNIEASKVKLANQKESLAVEKNKFKEIKEQIDLCEIRVPEGVEGQVVYAKESSRGGNDWVLEEGTTVRERQVLIRLPNPGQMEVKALINEQSITQIRVGMPASINVDALNSKSLRGVVTKVNQYAESNGWFSSSIRKYAVLVQIIDPPDTLKPGMNSTVSIQTRFEPNAVTAPIQTVYAVQNRQFCLVKTGETLETREIEVEADNAQVVMIKGGVKPGDQLVMNPGAYADLMELPEVELDRRIEISEAMQSKIDSLDEQPVTDTGNEPQAGVAVTDPGASGRPPGGPGSPSGPVGNRPGGGFDLPASGAALVQQKDQDSDGKLTKEEAGSPFENFFDYIDSDKDGFLTVAEADKSIQQLKQRMQDGGGGGRPGGPQQ